MKPIGRRTFLRGAGTVLALPFLESVSFGAVTRPKRIAFLFVPNGVHMADWRPKGAGADYALSPLLQPLADHRDDLLLVSNLAQLNARALGDGPGDHARSAACFLTGAHPVKTAGRNIRAGISVDQVAARHLGRDTSLPSLEIGCEPARQSGNCDSGYSCAYSSNISWRSPHSPMGKEIDPRALFERLFRTGPEGESAQARAERIHARRSILDYVRDDAATLSKRLGRADRRKLDEYFTGVRELERRIAMAEMAKSGDEIWLWNEEVDKPAPLNAPSGIPRDYKEHVRLMYDMLVLAFRLDRTRVATFMLANEGSNRNYAFIGAKGGHHHLSHHKGDRGKIERIKRINRFHVEQLAYFLKRLKGVREGDSTLLDSTAVVYGSAISDGNRHNHDDLPVLVAGRGGGIVRPGRHIVAPRRTPLCNLYVSLLNGVGVPATKFGDSTGALPLVT
ncbi:MAG: DUF1552 domain-containing protein [Planctomycetota bacterium]|jgi:hypothetical protein